MMKTIFRPPELGQSILIVMDTHPDSLEMIKTAMTYLPDLVHRSFTLLFCSFPRYWEHSGSEDPEVQHEIDAVWDEEEHEFARIDEYMETAKSLLIAAGVPHYHIFTRRAFLHESLIYAALMELKQCQYSGVIVNNYHEELVNRLRARGLTDLFRYIPKVTVWAINTPSLSPA
jgi:hypothetical protein